MRKAKHLAIVSVPDVPASVPLPLSRCVVKVLRMRKSSEIDVELKPPPTVELATGQTLGQTSRRYRAEGFEFVLSHYHPFAKLPRHEHADSYVCVNLSSAFVEVSNTDSGDTVPRFAAVTHPAGEAHENHFDARGGMCLSIFRDASRSQSWRLITNDHDVSTNEDTRAVGVAFLNNMQHYDQFEDCAALSFSELTLQLIRTLSNAPARGRLNFAGIWRALDAVNQDPLRAWTTDELAAVAQLHPTHLARQVRKITGQTFGEHVRRRRTLSALALLKKRDGSVADIAQRCGFADQSHLTRTLRRLTGLTPSNVRESR
jgi:AraC family transcriptional regulator